MKLRIHNNSIRLRLNQSEVAQFAERGRVEQALEFGSTERLVYCLEKGPALAAAFEGKTIRVTLPQQESKTWIESDQTGIEGMSGPVKVVVEKDYQCLHRASGEDADAFPNPMRRERT
jgi:hypothetical protein